METSPSARTAKPADVPQSTECPLTAALDAIGGKWSMICLYWLDSGTRRFNELHRLMPDISHKVLTATLRNLEHEQLICRTEFSELPPRVEYKISAHGESVRPLIEAVRLWGRAHLARRKS
jgi:DNA-binding HxlR family transcriptional regulator